MQACYAMLVILVEYAIGLYTIYNLIGLQHDNGLAKRGDIKCF